MATTAGHKTRASLATHFSFSCHLVLRDRLRIQNNLTDWLDQTKENSVSYRIAVKESMNFLKIKYYSFFSFMNSFFKFVLGILTSNSFCCFS